jgi:hypothetical protein
MSTPPGYEHSFHTPFAYYLHNISDLSSMKRIKNIRKKKILNGSYNAEKKYSGYKVAASCGLSAESSSWL